MNKLISYLSVIALMFSSLAFSANYENKEINPKQAMAYTLVCYGAYEKMGRPDKSNREMNRIVYYAQFLSPNEVNLATEEAIAIIDLFGLRGIGYVEVGKMCDEISS